MRILERYAALSVSLDRSAGKIPPLS